VSLTTGRGPLSANPSGRLCTDADGAPAYVEPFPRRVRATKDGRRVVDSEAVLLVHRRGAPPAYAFPAGDAGGLGEPEPLAEGYVRVRWGDADAWYEEDEQVFSHPRNPYHRVDCVPTSRRLRVEIEGTVVVDTDDTLGVYETSLAPRLYVARRNLLAGVLAESGTTTYCPYKGTATYWSATVGGECLDDVAWSYEVPNPECWAIRGHLCFDETKVSVEAALPTWPGATRVVGE
jgi:uncharacterized protein (DUF427 family)